MKYTKEETWVRDFFTLATYRERNYDNAIMQSISLDTLQALWRFITEPNHGVLRQIKHCSYELQKRNLRSYYMIDQIVEEMKSRKLLPQEHQI